MTYLETVKITWRDGRSEVRYMTPKQTMEWERLHNTKYVKSVEIK